jgi:hypothetical protein
VSGWLKENDLFFLRCIQRAFQTQSYRLYLSHFQILDPYKLNPSLRAVGPTPKPQSGLFGYGYWMYVNYFQGLGPDLPYPWHNMESGRG